MIAEGKREARARVEPQGNPEKEGMTSLGEGMKKEGVMRNSGRVS